MVDALQRIVDSESPTEDLDAVQHTALEVAEVGRGLLGTSPEVIEVDGCSHLRWSFGAPRVLILGHFDTVWPMGTIDRWPFALDGDRATGPGIFDMKGGLVQGLFAVSALSDLDGVEILFNSDEETGSRTSQALVEEAARRVKAALVLEPSADGALKVARKGIASYQLLVTGRAAHAGLEPERGINAVVELAGQIEAITKMGRLEAGTTVTPTLTQAGTAQNTIPAHAQTWIDVRARTDAELDRVQAELGSLHAKLDGAEVNVERRHFRSPLERSASANLFDLAVAHAEKLGLGKLQGVEVGGASDGNLTAGVGCPTLDGLGAVGAGAHAEGEHIFISKMAERAALVASLVEALRKS